MRYRRCGSGLRQIRWAVAAPAKAPSRLGSLDDRAWGRHRRAARFRRPCVPQLDLPPRKNMSPRRQNSDSVFELRHRLQLVLGRVVDGVIGIPISVGLPILRRSSLRPCSSCTPVAARGIAVDVRRRTVRRSDGVVVAVCRPRWLVRPTSACRKRQRHSVLPFQGKPPTPKITTALTLPISSRINSLMSPSFSLASL